jgi:hypothetical protein
LETGLRTRRGTNVDGVDVSAWLLAGDNLARVGEEAIREEGEENEFGESKEFFPWNNELGASEVEGEVFCLKLEICISTVSSNLDFALQSVGFTRW